MKEQWNERFSENGFAYGSEPNEFFKEQLGKLPAGKILLLAEGEGRNGVYAASKGWSVDAYDFSESGKEKAMSLAKLNGVSINYSIHPLEDIGLPLNYYDAIGLIYVHMGDNLRCHIAKKVINALKPGGTLILECFDKDQLGKSSGGPKEEGLLYSLENAVNDYSDLDSRLLAKETIMLNEGTYHIGEAVVIRFVGVNVE
ncbi:MAG: class I SAM-dependent methyltransferase [Ignavibacteria bacterium]